MRYDVAWHSPSKTLAILAPNADISGEKDADVVGNIVYAELGEIPDSNNHPQVRQHLANLAATQGVTDFELATVVNATGNDRLNGFAQEGNKALSDELDKQEQEKVLNNVDGLGNVTEPGEPQEGLQGDVDNSRELQAKHDAAQAAADEQKKKDDAKAAEAAEKLAAKAEAKKTA